MVRSSLNTNSTIVSVIDQASSTIHGSTDVRLLFLLQRREQQQEDKESQFRHHQHPRSIIIVIRDQQKRKRLNHNTDGFYLKSFSFPVANDRDRCCHRGSLVLSLSYYYSYFFYFISCSEEEGGNGISFNFGREQTNQKPTNSFVRQYCCCTHDCSNGLHLR